MSLFKLREFWSTQADDGETFDQNSLIITNLNTYNDFIITGSHTGTLRIFKPNCDLSENNNLEGFTATDLLVEKNFALPILQIGCGRLVSGSQNSQIAILHPRLVSVYVLRLKEGITEHGNQHYLDLLYEHHLQRSAANFVIGPFGGSQNRDFICVQSLDGMLSFFEQESTTFSCFLPEFLLPGPLEYVKKTDSFIAVGGDWSIAAYRYNQLSESGEQLGDTTVNSTGRVSNDWSYNLGEIVLDISIVEDVVNKEYWVMVLGERNLFCLTVRGKLKFMKRLDYSPICFHTYLLNDNIFSLVVSETNTLLIYENTTLRWSAKLQFLPICIRRVFLENIKGALVLLSEEGRLECGYLGTEPSLFVAPPLTQKEIDFEKVEEELEELYKILRTSYGSDTKLSNISSAEKELTMNVSVSSDFESCTYQTKIKDMENIQMCTITVDLLPQVPFDEIQVTLSTPLPLKINPSIQYFNNLSDKTSFTCHVYLFEKCPVPTLNIEVLVTLVTSLGVPRCLNKSLMLPLLLVADVCQPQKEGEHKITLNINENPVPLAALFPDFGGNPLLIQSTNAIGFKHYMDIGKPVTILLAKNSKRYRIQSDCFASLSLVIEQMIFRLKKHYSNSDNFRVFYNSALPSESVVPYITDHFRTRQEVIQLQNDLDQFSAQFRIIQKRLIAKLKTKNPSPLTNLEILMKDTYLDIMQATEKLNMNLLQQVETQIQLSCALHLLGDLMGLMDLDKGTKEALESVFLCNVYDVDSQNWEDVMDSSLCYLLRTSLAKSEKDTMRVAQTSFEEIKDVSKVEKHIVQVLDRISKKEKEEENDDDDDDDKDQDVTENDIEETEKEDEKPIGSQFGEASTRLLSARKSLLRRKQNVDQ